MKPRNKQLQKKNPTTESLKSNAGITRDTSLATVEKANFFNTAKGNAEV